MAAPVVAGIGTGAAATAAAPLIAATAAVIGTSALAASVFKPGCREGIDMYINHHCEKEGWSDFVCAMVRTYTVSNCGGLLVSGTTIALASGGLLSDPEVRDLWKKVIELGLQKK